MFVYVPWQTTKEVLAQLEAGARLKAAQVLREAGAPNWIVAKDVLGKIEIGDFHTDQLQGTGPATLVVEIGRVRGTCRLGLEERR